MCCCYVGCCCVVRRSGDVAEPVLLLTFSVGGLYCCNGSMSSEPLRPTSGWWSAGLIRILLPALIVLTAINPLTTMAVDAR